MGAPRACDLAFTPVESTIGGVCIGVAAATLLLCYGRVLGFSGILNEGTLKPITRGRLPELWRLAVLLGLVAGGCVSATFSGFPSPTIDYSLGVYSAVGLLMGFGTAAGQGCTSGHGICGLGRLSPRSLVAVCTFIVAAVATTYVAIQHIDGVDCASEAPWLAPYKSPAAPANLVAPPAAAVATLAAAVALTKLLEHGGAGAGMRCLSSSAHVAVGFLAGLLSGIGLVLGGMLDQAKVRGFLNIAGQWDPSLMFVMGGGVTVSLVAHQVALRRPAPLLAPVFSYPPTCEFGTTGTGPIKDPRLLLGSVAFGVAWGALGICPGPSVVGLAAPLVDGADMVAAQGAEAVFRFPLFVASCLVGFVVATTRSSPSASPSRSQGLIPSRALASRPHV